MRLQKYMALCGVASRRACEELILQGRVRVNDVVIDTLGTKIDQLHDEVYFDERKLMLEQAVTAILYKPTGVMCTNQDPQGRLTVQDFVKEIPVRLYHIGRLDYETEGLILMSNDGELANVMMHPSFEIPKTYLAKCRGYFTEEQEAALHKGVLLEDGMAAPAMLEIIQMARDHTLLRITIHEGRNRQVRRMLEAVDHPVITLKREQVANFKLDGLKPGNWRIVSDDEINQFYSLAK